MARDTKKRAEKNMTEKSNWQRTVVFCWVYDILTDLYR